MIRVKLGLYKGSDTYCDQHESQVMSVIYTYSHIQAAYM